VISALNHLDFEKNNNKREKRRSRREDHFFKHERRERENRHRGIRKKKKNRKTKKKRRENKEKKTTRYLSFLLTYFQFSLHIHGIKKKFKIILMSRIFIHEHINPLLFCIEFLFCTYTMHPPHNPHRATSTLQPLLHHVGPNKPTHYLHFRA